MSVFFLCQYSGRKEEVYLIAAKFYLHYTAERTQKVEVWALLSTSPTLQFIEHNRLPALKKLQQKDKMEECLTYQTRKRKLQKMLQVSPPCRQCFNCANSEPLLTSRFLFPFRQNANLLVCHRGCTILFVIFNC